MAKFFTSSNVGAGLKTGDYTDVNSRFGKNYGGKTDYTTTGAFDSGIDDIISGLTLFENTEEIEVDFILMGAAHYSKENHRQLLKKQRC
ncbi:MAG: hypothetical protein CM15mP113_0260 [Pseudomonadota bacterium]|nr:MAG: hypothetical protein CM15mP113_0260 [Pseudomonadota bacterium]